MQNAGYILVAFSVIWAVLFGYVLVLITREARLRRNIESLKEDFGKIKEERSLERRDDLGGTQGTRVA